MATIKINRAPVLTLWGAVVAEKLGQDPQAALTFGKCLAGLNAQAKGRMIGIFGEPKEPKEAGTKPKKVGLGEEFWFEVCGRPLPAKNTDDGVRAVVKDKPIDPAKVQAYLERAFGATLADVRQAMEDLAGAFSPNALKISAYDLYGKFRPAIERGQRGWGQKGILDLEFIRSLAPK